MIDKIANPSHFYLKFSQEFPNAIWHMPQPRKPIAQPKLRQEPNSHLTKNRAQL